MMSDIVIAILLVGGIIILYFGSYLLNKNTKAPEGIEPAEKCTTCGSRGACSLSQREELKKHPDEECEFESLN
jgi:hypothetical protein